MTDPKPSEILRPLLNDRGALDRSRIAESNEKVFAILDRLDAEQRRLAAKVDGPAKPDTTPEAPKLAELAEQPASVEDEREELKSTNLFQYGQLLASRQQVVAEKERADAAEKRVAELEEKLSAAESEARRLRELINEKATSMMKQIANQKGGAS